MLLGKKFLRIFCTSMTRLYPRTSGTEGSEVKIAFDGKEYDSPENMPDDARRLYEEILAAAQDTDSDSPVMPERRGKMAESILTQHGHTDWSKSDEEIRPTATLKRWVIIAFLTLLGLILLYFLFRQG